MNILTVNLLFSTFVFWVAARIYVLPNLTKLEPADRSTADSSASLGSSAPGAHVPRAGSRLHREIPPQFAYPAAFGDLLAALLALAAIPAVAKGSRVGAGPLVWILNVEGDGWTFIAAIALATIYGAPARVRGYGLYGSLRSGSPRCW